MIHETFLWEMLGKGKGITPERYALTARKKMMDVFIILSVRFE